jgi:hypothetical protein
MPNEVMVQIVIRKMRLPTREHKEGRRVGVQAGYGLRCPVWAFLLSRAPHDEPMDAEGERGAL